MAQPQQAPQHLTMPHSPMPHPHPQMPQMPQMSQMQQHQQISQMSPQLAPRAPYQQQQVQNSPSPVNTIQAGFAVNPHKRPRVSPGPQGTASQPNSQPASPYLQTTPYAMSPQAHNQSATTAHSPNYGNAAAAASPQSYSAPYTNGNTAPLPSPASISTPVATTPPITLPTTSQTLHLPEVRPSHPPTPGPIRPATPSLATPQPQYTTATMAPIGPPPTSNAGTMGPPSKPADKPTKEYEYDISDALAGTGVDLRNEELALAELYAGSFLPDARTGLPSNPPGTKGSMYGAGWANQPGVPPEGKTQAEWEAEIAKQAWEEASQRLAIIRSNEIRDPFCQISVLHHKAEKIAKEYGLSLNSDMKTPNQPLGKMKLPHDFHEKPTITVSTKTYPDGAIVKTTGSWIPHDAYLVDQLALLSIATKHRLRELLEDAEVVATTRQTTSHGEVPEEWADVAVPLKYGVEAQDTPESAASPRANPLKRSFDVASAEPSFAGKSAQFNTLNRAMRDGQNADRNIEEARLKKRQKRLNPDKAGTTKTAATPGTPGGAAPETEPQRAPTKKETKKSIKAASLAAESSNAEANQTVNTFLVSSFGRKKNKYSWMAGGGAASGASTPRASGGAASAAGSPAPSKQAAKPGMLTPEPRTRPGTWREDNEKGKGIQLRDWVVVLERDGKDGRAIQTAYDKLDSSGPK